MNIKTSDDDVALKIAKNAFGKCVDRMHWTGTDRFALIFANITAKTIQVIFMCVRFVYFR
jgi:hypothetical protein